MRRISLMILMFCAMLAVISVATATAQETTGGLQGTVKDPSGAVVPNATVTVSGPALIGDKTQTSDSTGYYRFANLPPGTYTVKVTAAQFSALSHTGIVIEVGHLPTLDIALKIGAVETTVEVSSAAPTIDVTTTHAMTNITQDVINEVPHGRTFQSVIQFAPSAREEPLAGLTSMGKPMGGSGGSLPGSSGNGLAYGFSVGGASDSENAYLVEGQDTSNVAGGYSKANVPFEFIQEVQVKTSGIEAEHGGALGGVVNVVMKKGSNTWHGSLFSSYESDAFDASPNNFLRYNPDDQGNPAVGLDQSAQLYQPRKDRFRLVQPGGTLGGAIIKDRLWFFAGVAPYYQSLSRDVNFQNKGGIQTLTQDQKSYYGTARLDATVTQRIRLFSSWLTQGVRANGVNLPDPDSLQGYTNSTISTPLINYSHSLGYSAPNQTFNVGADITLTPRMVSTTRFGYFFENYHDFGWPTAGTDYSWRTTGLSPATDYSGNPFPAGLQQAAGTETTPFTQSYTVRNANKHWQFGQDVAFFKSGWAGTHNFKIGYQFNKLSNDINQNGNVPYVRLYLARPWSPLTSFGAANCATLKAQRGVCAGQEGYLRVQDFTTQGAVTDTNHGLYAQDAWTIGRGLTINAGLRIEKEQIPAPNGTVLAGHTIDFNWGDKIEPRLGVAWDPFRNGKAKVFGSYGVVNDVMKLLLAMTSFGGQSYEECAYAMGPQFNPNTATATFVNGRGCPSAAANVGANWAGGSVPAALSLIENVNLRPFEPVAPGVKPYRQHESAFGIDVQLSNNYALETRWDRRRLDHVLEDASLTDVTWGETYTIVNPGEGVNATLNGYANFLGSLGEVFGVPGWSFDPKAFGTCTGCPNNPKAYRSYDGVEFRLTRALANHWAGSFSYTYSRLRGNYSGLTTTEQLDGNEAGRNSPDTSRAFDEPTAYFRADGSSSNGPLPTDRPNTLKGYVYYDLNEGKRNATTFGIFQVGYQGTPLQTFMDVGSALPGQPSYAQYIYGRDQWLDPSQITINASTGAITLGNPTTARTPWFVQSDINVKHEIKISSNDEAKVLAFGGTLTNAFNQHSATSYYMGLNSTAFSTSLSPGSDLNQGAAGYQAIEKGYNLQQWINNPASPIIVSSQYGKPTNHQLPRTIRLQISYTF
jgi:hypothetical protein